MFQTNVSLTNNFFDSGIIPTNQLKTIVNIQTDSKISYKLEYVGINQSVNAGIPIPHNTYKLECTDC